MSGTLVASDLDRTLIYSRSFLSTEPFADRPDRDDVVCVERYHQRDASWMTDAAAQAWAALHRDAVVVPTTTRTMEQYRRVRLPGPPPRYAITGNGGVLLVDGEPDLDWARTVDAALAEVAPLREVIPHAVRALGRIVIEPRIADDLFFYVVGDNRSLPAGFAAEQSALLDPFGWHASVQGRKIYWVPRTLTKSAAVAEIARREGTEMTLAAGDSLLDTDLLEAADAGIAARHGELIASGWRAPQVDVTAACGLAAGEEIARWFGRRLASRITT